MPETAGTDGPPQAKPYWQRTKEEWASLDASGYRMSEEEEKYLAARKNFTAANEGLGKAYEHARDYPAAATYAELERAIETTNLAIRQLEACLPPGETVILPLAPAGAPRRRPRRAIEPLTEHLKFSGNLVHKGAVEALSNVHRWVSGDRLFRAYESAGVGDHCAVLTGFAVDPGAEIWGFLKNHGPAAIKGHYALWARLYEQTGARPGEHAAININQFCADLGFKPHHKGGYKIERKQEAMRILETLTTVEIAVRFLVRGQKDRMREVRGRLWERGFLAWERDTYGDLFGRLREGDPTLWDPQGFSYGPGPWFRDPEWRRQNQFMGLIGAGMMKLRTDQDQTAILIAGYLGSLVRINQYRPFRVRVNTLLERIGMADRYVNHPQTLREKIEQAFEKLVEPEIGMLARWKCTDAEPDEPDMDNSADLVALARFESSPWRKQVIEFAPPAALAREAERLEKQQQQAVREAQSKAKAKARDKALPEAQELKQLGPGENPD